MLLAAWLLAFAAPWSPGARESGTQRGQAVIARIKSQRKNLWRNASSALSSGLCAMACSSAPIPSAEERQVDDAAEASRPAKPAPRPVPPVAPQASAAPTNTATAPRETSTASSNDGTTKPIVDGSTACTSDAGCGCTTGVDCDGGAPDAGEHDAGEPDATTTSEGNARDDGSDAQVPSESEGDGDGGSTFTAEDGNGAQDELLPLGTDVCPPTLQEDLHYAEGSEFWLGDQSEFPLRVNGYGYFASREPDTWTPAHRFAQTLAVSVRPDGVLEDQAGFEVLGYDVSPESSSCLMTLKAPIALPPKATKRVAITMNLDSRSSVTDEVFDSSRPASEIAAPITVSCVDEAGAAHVLLVYFECNAEGSFRYHVLVSSKEVWPDSEGLFEVGFGDLQFDANGALVSEMSLEMCVDFAGTFGTQCLEFDFGEAILDDGASGLDGSTSFAADTVVSRLTTDGYSAGTSTKVEVDARGTVAVRFDNGQSRPIGTLAIARFPNEDRLLAVSGSAFAQTTDSGAPAFDRPGSAGRGTVLR